MAHSIQETETSFTWWMEAERVTFRRIPSTETVFQINMPEPCLSRVKKQHSFVRQTHLRPGF